MTEIIIAEPMGTLVLLFVTAILFLCIGYGLSLRVAFYMYDDLEKKYTDLLAEYDRYRGMVKAIKDYKGDANE